MSEREQDLDVIIIGAGPAGISAAIWCKDLGLNAVVLEKNSEAGGQLLSIYNPITNYPGLRTENGREMRDRFLESANSSGVDIRLGTEVVEIDPKGKFVKTADGKFFRGQAVILASGVSRRRLNIPGEAEFAGRGVIKSGSKERELARGKTVAIIGGGDAALENAIILSEYAAKIYVIHRRNSFTARDEFVRRAAAAESIEFRFNTHVSRIMGAGRVSSIELVNSETGVSEILRTDIVLLRIGVEPNTQLLGPSADLDAKGYACPVPYGHRNDLQIFAIGDIADPVGPTIAAAVGTGATAAKGIWKILKGW